MIIIGEKINGSIPIVAEAIAKRDSEFIKERAKLQAESGATYIDCCASVPEAEEVETLKWMIDCIQEVTDLPISIDSPKCIGYCYRCDDCVWNESQRILPLCGCSGTGL